MIRAMQASDLEEVMQIWLTANMEAHDFIDSSYWKSHFEEVRALLPQAEIMVSENTDTGVLEGFIGIMESYIAGFFVRQEYRSRGIGRQFLDFAKAAKPELKLKVYKKNEAAVNFYLREDFLVLQQGQDEDTGEEEFTMEWKGRDAFM